MQCNLVNDKNCNNKQTALVRVIGIQLMLDVYSLFSTNPLWITFLIIDISARDRAVSSSLSSSKH